MSMRFADLETAESAGAGYVSPIADALTWSPVKEALLLSDPEPGRLERFVGWLCHRTR
jgi:hypothetical protein